MMDKNTSVVNFAVCAYMIAGGQPCVPDVPGHEQRVPPPTGCKEDV